MIKQVIERGSAPVSGASGTAGVLGQLCVVTISGVITTYECVRVSPVLWVLQGGGRAVDISNTPAGSIAATNVQAAINELATDKAPLASPSFTGSVNSLGSITVNGATAYIRTIGDLGSITTTGEIAYIRTSGELATISTTGESANISTYGANANIITNQGQFIGAGTGLTGTAASLTAGSSNGLKSATTTVSVSASTAPTTGQVLTATSSTAATWQTPSGSTYTAGTGLTLTGSVFSVTAGTYAQLSGGNTFAGPQAFSSTTRPTSSGTGAPAATSMITLQDVDSQLASRIPDSLYLHDRFATGGTTNGSIGELGWTLGGTGGGYNRAGVYGLLVPASTISAALNCATLSFTSGDYAGSLGIYSRSTARTFDLISRISQYHGWASGKPSSWSMYFAADASAGVNPNRIIPNNAVGIAAIDTADATWAALTPYVVGNTLAPTTPNGYKYICTTAGTSGASAPTWPTTFAGTVADGTAVFVNAGRDGSSNFIFFVTGADALTNITVAASSIPILTAHSGATWFDLSIKATATGYNFSVNGETPVTIADTTTLLGTPGFAVRNDTSQTAVGMLRLRHFGFFGAVRNF